MERPIRNPQSAIRNAGEVFVPASRQGALYPAVAAAIALLIALALVVRALLLGISFASFLMLLAAIVLLIAGALAAYWAWACATLRYELERGVLRITWGLSRHEIPVTLLERAVRGRAGAQAPVRGLNWPGCHIGEADLPRLGRVRFLSLHRAPTEVLYLAGPSATYAISPSNSTGFIRRLQEQMEYHAPLDASRVTAHPLLLRALSWRDQPVQAVLAAAATLALLATAIVFSRYAGLPDQAMLNFPEESRIGDRSALLGIPLAAWLLLLVNSVAGVRLAAERRTAAFTLLYGLAFVEALLVVAAVTAV